MTRSPTMTATCACGRVELEAFGKPIVSTVCYCDDCQKGADQIEALPNAWAPYAIPMAAPHTSSIEKTASSAPREPNC